MASEYVHIFSESAIIVNRIKIILDENNILSLIKNHTESGRLAGFGTPQNSVEIHVLETNVERAKKIIEQFNT